MNPDNPNNIQISVLERLALMYPEGAFVEAQRTHIPHIRNAPYWRIQVRDAQGKVLSGLAFDTRTAMLKRFEELKGMCRFLNLFVPEPCPTPRPTPHLTLVKGSNPTTPP